MALGLTTSEAISDYWSKNTRRRIFYNYPNGTAPLTGFLSMMDSEDTPIQEFGWQEKRWQAIQTITAGGDTSTVVFYQAGTTTTLGTPATVAAATAIRMYVDDASDFQINNTIAVFDLDLTGSKTDNLTGVITAVNTTGADYIEFTATAALPATLLNSASANVGNYIYCMGSAYAEGTRTDSGRIKFPYEAINYTQTHKTRFDLTRNALKNPTTYDKSGAYKDALKDNGIDHLTGIELTMFFQDRLKTTETVKGKTVKKYFSGGLLWFLKQWELGSVANGGAFDYGQADVSAQTDWQTYTNKRIIKLGGSTITKSAFGDLNSRAFEKTNSKEWSKLCLCGPGYLNRVTDMFEKQIQYTSLRDEGYKGFNFEMVKHTTNSGTVYYKSHPLFNDPMMRNSAFYIDPGHIKWRPFQDSDTDVYSGVQENDEDIRADMWLTEGGPEFAFPEAHMFVQDLGGITL